jgi:hypothetical protein
MVWQCPAWSACCKQLAWLWLVKSASGLKILLATVPMGHGMSKISHTEPSQHCNITHWTHMEEMEWFGSAAKSIIILFSTLF